MTTMGSRLRQARKARGLTVREMAKRLGVQHPYVTTVESGRQKSIHTAKLVTWCRLLAVSTDWVLGVWDDWEPGQEESVDSERLAAAV